MKHDWIRFRLVLPLVFGLLAAVLMTWDYQNNRMVGLMGMGWDIGPLFWPYQAIYLLLFTINAPAFVLSMPILKLLNLQTLSLQYGVWFPAIVGWWWWIGTRIDFGILGRRSIRCAKLVAGGLSAVSLCFCIPLFAPASVNSTGGWNMVVTLRRSGCQRLSELLVQFCGVWSSLVDVGLRRCVSFKAELRQR